MIPDFTTAQIVEHMQTLGGFYRQRRADLARARLAGRIDVALGATPSRCLARGLLGRREATMAHVEGTRAQLLSLLGHLPRCEARPCRAQVARRSKRAPIATHLGTRRDLREVVCGVCAGQRPATATKPLDYRDLLRRLLQIVASGQVIDAGQVLTLVNPGADLIDVTGVLDDDTSPHR